MKPRTFPKELRLTRAAEERVFRTRESRVRQHLKEVERLNRMTACDVVADGIDVHTATSEVAGRLARKDLREIVWSESDGGWRRYADDSEGPISAEEVEDILNHEDA